MVTVIEQKLKNNAHEDKGKYNIDNNFCFTKNSIKIFSYFLGLSEML